MKAATRYDAIIATFIGVLALLVSAYTAYLQKQQVRAQVYPVVQFGSGSNEEDFHVLLDNKGMGPALIKNVIITLDGKPMHDWQELMQRVLGSDQLAFGYDSFGQRALAAGENLRVLSFVKLTPPEQKAGQPAIAVEDPMVSRKKLMDSRKRWRVSICYCSTLGDCWTLIESHTENELHETRRCPEPTADSFD